MDDARKGGTDTEAALSLWASAGHDLRQPIQSLLLMVHLMALTDDAEKRRNTAKSMEAALQSLQSMIGDLARFARFDTGTTPRALGDVALDVLARRAAEQQRSVGRAQAQTIAIDVQPSVVRTDERMAAELIAGLIRLAAVLSKGDPIQIRSVPSSSRPRLTIEFAGPPPTGHQLGGTFVDPPQPGDATAAPVPGLRMLKVLSRLIGAEVDSEPLSDDRQTFSITFPDEG